ncbi:hypothetical protein B566_EDAN005343 [Ephemera danica]|nr:hypothetical protein B566_EDAN005343 [Ephemera danica]
MLRARGTFCVFRRLISGLSYAHRPGEQPLLSLTVGQLLETASQRWGDREALVSMHQQRRLTFKELRDESTRMAAGLLKQGLKPGERLGIWAPNSVEWEVAMLAAAKAGFILVNINPAYEAPELRHSLSLVQVSALILADALRDRNFHEILMRAVPDLKYTGSDGQVQSRELSSLRNLITIGRETPPNNLKFEDLRESDLKSAEQDVQVVEKKVETHDAYNIQYTSGTTGRPKATLLTHHGTVNNAFIIGKAFGYAEKVEHRICMPNPLFHCFGCVVGVLCSLNFGAGLVMPAPTHSPTQNLRAVQEERCTALYGTPTMHVDFVKEARSKGLTARELGLQLMVTGGSLCPETVYIDLKTDFGIPDIVNVYGMTECSPVNFSTVRTDDIAIQATKIGRIGEHWEAKVVDLNGKMVPFGVPGELWVRGYGTMLGYWEDPVATAATIRSDGWLITGDQFVIDENGYGNIVGRLKDMIIRGGENIFPIEIEETLHSHPDVLEAHVYGAPDDRLGEVVCANIRPRPNRPLTPEQIREFCHGKPLLSLTVGELLETASQRWESREALVSVHQKRHLTFKELRNESTRLASGLLKLGLKPGERLGIWSPNNMEWVVTMLAAAKAGFILININPAYEASELRHSLSLVKVSTLIMADSLRGQNFHEILMRAVPDLKHTGSDGQVESHELPALRNIISIGPEIPSNTLKFDNLLESDLKSAEKDVEVVENKVQAHDAYNIQFTSGTTGRPKATLLTHHGTTNNSFIIGKAFGCTTLYGTPTMHVDFVKEARARGLKAKDLGLHLMVTGGSLFPEFVYMDFRTDFGIPNLINLYGMTETCPVNFCTVLADDIALQSTYLGRIGEHWEAKVVDSNGKMVLFGEPGELWLRGYGTMLGYWDNPTATASTITSDGWLKTGDQFVLDKNGYGNIVGRLKDMIIRGGENIFPKEIEETLHSHPDILEAHVYGVPDDRLGEAVCANIRPRQNTPLTPDNVQTFCKGKVFVRFVSGLSYAHHPGEQPLMSLTVGQLLETASQRWGEREALVSMHQQRRLTFKELRDESTRVAAGLLKLGLKPGERVGIWAPNNIEWEVAMLAAAKAGFILVNINPAYEALELRHSLSVVKCSALIMADSLRDRNFQEILLRAVPDLKYTGSDGQVQSREFPSLRNLITIGPATPKSNMKFEDLLESNLKSAEHDVQVIENRVETHDAYNIQFTSGTTGLPKATLLTHHGTVNNAFVIGKRMGFAENEHRICLPVPLFHCFGSVLGILCSLHFGAGIVMPAPLHSPTQNLHAVQEERCTSLYGTPTMHVDFVKEARARGLTASDLGLQMMAIGGSLCPEALYRELRTDFRIPNLIIGYGMTECSPIVFTTKRSDDISVQATHTGCITDHWEVKVVNSDGKMVPFGEPGELWVRGYGTMLGYWGDPVATADTLRSGGWLRTGDRFVLKENGYANIVGRIKDMIIRGGENIFPMEIEETLHSHPDILEAHVYGVPDERLGEVVCANIRPRINGSLAPEQVREFCQGKMAQYKIPLHIAIVDDFPKTASGKIQKYILRSQMIEKLKKSAMEESKGL